MIQRVRLAKPMLDGRLLVLHPLQKCLHGLSPRREAMRP